MALTFWGYIGIHIGCGVGIFILTGVILALLSKYDHGIYSFLMKCMLGIQLEYATDETLQYTLSYSRYV
jgi:uncharacterized membrane protein